MSNVKLQHLISAIILGCLILLVGGGGVYILLRGESQNKESQKNNGQENLNVQKKKSKLDKKIQLPKGRWARLRKDFEKASPENAAHQEQIRKLEAIGYMDAYEPAPKHKSVVSYNRKKSYSGYNLYTSGHSPVAILIDMEGRVCHTWSIRFFKAFNSENNFDDTRDHFILEIDRHNFRRVHLFENGDLLAIFEGFGLIKLDKDSNLLWSQPNGSHHDLEVTGDGQIMVITRKAMLDTEINPDTPVLLDAISFLDKQGKEKKRISIYHAFMNSPFRSKLDVVRFYPKFRHIQNTGDFMHTNTVERLDGRLVNRSAAFREGNLLISMREPSLIAVINPEKESVEWCSSGFWSAQHHPTILSNGNMLIFDNLGGDKQYGQSRVVEFDPFTLEFTWVFEGTKNKKFNSPIMGSVQRLPNGNTLITETQAGRVIEVTPDKEIVWEFLNPHRAGENDELIAHIGDMIRLPSEFPLDWLEN